MARAFKVTVVLVVIGALAAIAYKRGRPDSDAGNPLAVEINRLHADAERLHADVGANIASLETTTTRLSQSMRGVDDRISEIQQRADETRVDFARQKRTLDKFSTLVAENEGALLSGGQYVAPDVVRQQYEFQRERLDAMRHKLLALNEQREIVERLRHATTERHDKASTTLRKLRGARDQVHEQLRHLNLLIQAFAHESSAEATFEGDVRRIQHEILAVQDQLEVYIRDLPETLALKQVPAAEITLPDRQRD